MALWVKFISRIINRAVAFPRVAGFPVAELPAASSGELDNHRFTGSNSTNSPRSAAAIESVSAFSFPFDRRKYSSAGRLYLLRGFALLRAGFGLGGVSGACMMAGYRLLPFKRVSMLPVASTMRVSLRIIRLDETWFAIDRKYKRRIAVCPTLTPALSRPGGRGGGRVWHLLYVTRGTCLVT